MTDAPNVTPQAAPPEHHEHAVKRSGIWIARGLSYLVYAYVLVVELILLLGFVLLLFGANPTSSFVQWAYRNLDRAMRPFRGIFAPVELGTAGNDVAAIFDTSIVFAMIIYGIAAIAIGALISWLSTRINAVDRERALNEQRDRHQQELQAFRDQATIVEARNAAAQAEAAERAARQLASEQAARSSASTGTSPPPPPPPRP